MQHAGDHAWRRNDFAVVRLLWLTRFRLFCWCAGVVSYRPSGFTRVVHVRRRDGDNAPLSYLEFVDRPNELRPAIIQTPQTWQQNLENRRINDERQRNQRY